MPQPTAYARQYSFQAYQVANPEDPLPGQKVDIELNAVKTTLDEILVNLALIQRDDGEIANNSIGTSQLDGALISLGFERPSAWVTATAYAVDDAVFQSNKLYLCLTAHTSGVFATDLAAVKWEEVIDFTTLVTDAEAARDDAQGYAADALASKNSALEYASDIFAGGSSWYGATTGTNAYTVATNDYQPGVRPDGFEASFLVVIANTGAVDVTIGGYTIDDVKHITGAELSSGEWPANSVQTVKWSTTLGYYVWSGSNPAAYARLSGANTFAAAATFGSTVGVTGTTTLSGALVANGSATFNDPATFTDTVALNGAVTLGAALGANAAVTIGKALIMSSISLTDAATIAWDVSTGTNFEVTLGGNRVLGAFTGGVAGQRGTLRVIQDGTGGRTLDLSNAVYDFSGGLIEPITTGASEVTEYEFEVITANTAMRLKRRWMSGRSSIGFWKEYELDTSINDTSLYTQAHGLGRYPALVQLMLECTVTDGEWVVGDRMFVSAEIAASSGTNNGVTVCVNTTNVLVAFSAGVTMVRKTTNDRVVITESSWKPVLRIYT